MKILKTSLETVKEVQESLTQGGKVFCFFSQGEKYQVHSMIGYGANAWVILSTVGPVNFFSRRIQEWQILNLEDIHNFGEESNCLQIPERQKNDAQVLLRNVSNCSSEWSSDDQYHLVKIPSYLWQEIIDYSK